MADVKTDTAPANPFMPEDEPKAYEAKPVAGPKAEPVVSEPIEHHATIGSPDIFLIEKHKAMGAERVRILQVWKDAEDRGYVIVDNTAGNSRKVGYVELHEGMELAEAEKALNGAYDGTAAVL